MIHENVNVKNRSGEKERERPSDGCLYGFLSNTHTNVQQQATARADCYFIDSVIVSFFCMKGMHAHDANRHWLSVNHVNGARIVYAVCAQTLRSPSVTTFFDSFLLCFVFFVLHVVWSERTPRRTAHCTIAYQNYIKMQHFFFSLLLWILLSLLS